MQRSLFFFFFFSKQMRLLGTVLFNMNATLQAHDFGRRLLLCRLSFSIPRPHYFGSGPFQKGHAAVKTFTLLLGKQCMRLRRHESPMSGLLLPIHGRQSASRPKGLTSSPDSQIARWVSLAMLTGETQRLCAKGGC